MLRINLLPYDRQQKKFPVHKLTMLAIYGLFGLTLLTWAFNLGLYKYTQAQVKNSQEELGKLSIWQQRFDLNQVQNAELKRKGLIVQNLSKNRLVWSDVLSQLVNVTTNGVWLIKVSQDNRNPQDIILEGGSLTLDNILAFVHNLQQDPQNSSVVFENSSNKKAARSNQALINFKIRVTRRGGINDAK